MCKGMCAFLATISRLDVVCKPNTPEIKYLQTSKTDLRLMLQQLPEPYTPIIYFNAHNLIWVFNNRDQKVKLIAEFVDENNLDILIIVSLLI